MSTSLSIIFLQATLTPIIHVNEHGYPLDVGDVISSNLSIGFLSLCSTTAMLPASQSSKQLVYHLEAGQGIILPYEDPLQTRLLCCYLMP